MNKFYKILGVDSNISDEELKSAYRNLLKRYHPDTYLGDKLYASKKTAEINEAYAEILAFREKNNIKIEKQHKEQAQTVKVNVKKYNNKTSKNVNYDEVPVENSAEVIVKYYKRIYSQEEKRAKRILDILIFSLSAITIGLILFLIFYR